MAGVQCSTLVGLAIAGQITIQCACKFIQTLPKWHCIKSGKGNYVVPAKAGNPVNAELDPRLCGGDGLKAVPFDITLHFCC